MRDDPMVSLLLCVFACTTGASSFQASVASLCVCVCTVFHSVQFSALCERTVHISFIVCFRVHYSIDVCLCLHCFPEFALVRAIVARVGGAGDGSILMECFLSL